MMTVGDPCFAFSGGGASRNCDGSALIGGLGIGLALEAALAWLLLAGQSYYFTLRLHLALGALVKVLADWTNCVEPISVLHTSAKKQNAQVRAHITWVTRYLRETAASD